MGRFGDARTRPNEAPMPDPLAYFLTWTTYGSWLPGDPRGWVKVKKGFQFPSPIIERYTQSQLKEPICTLDDPQRAIVEATIAQHCTIRRWKLHAANCRTNHVHAVVSSTRNPDEVREQFKAWCTRKLKEAQAATGNIARKNWWTEKGSTRYIGDDETLEAATLYVLEAQ